VKVDDDVAPKEDDGCGGSDGPGGFRRRRRRWRRGGGGTTSDSAGHGHGHRRLVGAALHPQAEPVRVRPQGTFWFISSLHVGAAWIVLMH